MGDHFPGYPISSEIPNTSFICQDEYGDGFYADMESKCQSFHMCRGGNFESFLCPVGTVFSQKDRVCDFFYNVDCSTTPLYYNQPASPDLESLETVSEFQTIHEDGFVVPPKREQEFSLDYLEENNISDVTMAPSIKDVPELDMSPILDVPVIPVPSIAAGIPVIQPVEVPVSNHSSIPIIQPVEVPVSSHSSIPIIEPASEISVPVIEVVPVTSTQAPSSTTGKIQSSVPEVPVTNTEHKPHSIVSQIQEPIAENISTIDSNHKITFPINDDKPFFDPVKHAERDSFTFPKLDSKEHTNEFNLFTLPSVKYMQHAEIDVAKPSAKELPHFPSTDDNLNQTQVIRITVKKPIVGLNASLQKTVPPKPSPIPQMQLPPLLFKINNMRFIKPIIRTVPHVYQIPQAQIATFPPFPVRPTNI